MADKKAIATGLWSATSTWDGGTPPGPTDDVYANGFTVTIDEPITVNRLRTVAGTGIVSGGEYRVTGAVDIEITAGISSTDFGTSQDLIKILMGDYDVTIVAPTINGGGSGVGGDAIIAQPEYVGTLDITGNLRGNHGRALYTEDACTVNIHGNLEGFWNGCVYATGDGAVFNIWGNLGVASESGYLALDTRAAVTVNIWGDLIGHSYQAAGYTGGYGAKWTVRGNLRAHGEEGVAMQVEVYSPDDVLRVSGHIWAEGTYPGDDMAAPGLFPITGGWCKIADEDLTIHLFDDANFPTSAAGNVIEAGGGGSGAVPTSGVVWPPRYV